MSTISRQQYDQANNQVKEIWDKQVKTFGKMTNMKKTLAHSHLALRNYMDWYPMKDAVAQFLGERATIIFVHTLSSETDCLICSTYFRKTLQEWGENPDDLSLDEFEEKLVEFARYLVKDANNVPNELLANLKAKLSEPELVLLTAFGGLMIATNIFNNALKIDLDEYLYEHKKEG